MMETALSSDIALLGKVNSEVLEHSGKQLRPMVSLLVAKALGVPGEDSIRFAAAAELLHNATLIHDDVADESPQRRGIPTVRTLLGPSSAVLVGDFWLAAAVKSLLGASRKEKVLSRFSGTLTSLAEGEMLQLQKAGSADTSEEDYLKIIECKTASLFEVAAVAGAQSVDAPEECVQAAGRYARLLGMAFQIKDDILDYAGSSQLGKPTGIDLKEKKITLPLLGALKDSPREGEVRRMVREIDSCPENAALIEAFVAERGGVKYASTRLDEFVDAALQALQALPQTPARGFLEEIARFNSIRNV